MHIFISWSGEKSNLLAKALREWLPAVVQAVRPYFSTDDIKKGSRWNADVTRELQEAKVGLLCVTSENLNAPWVMFEAGALAKSLEASLVVPILLDVEPSALVGPLAQFQAARLDFNDMKQVIQTINSQLGAAALPDSILSSVFEKWWPDLEAKTAAIRATRSTAATPPLRSDHELLEEVLSHVRDLNLRGGGAKLGFAEFSRLLDSPIADMNFTERTFNNLAAEGINSVADLVGWSESALLKTPSMGRRALNEVKEVLASKGLRLKIDEADL